MKLLEDFRVKAELDREHILELCFKIKWLKYMFNFKS